LKRSLLGLFIQYYLDDQIKENGFADTL